MRLWLPLGVGVAVGLGLLALFGRSQTPVAANPTYRSYYVSKPAEFMGLWLPLPANAQVFHNGILLLPGEDYATFEGTFAVVVALAGGDRVTVASWASVMGPPGAAGLPGKTGNQGPAGPAGSGAGTIATGRSGALDCVSEPGVCDIVTAIVPLKTSANAWTGFNDFSGAASLRLRSGAGVPLAGCSVMADAGGVYVRNDAAAPGKSLYVCDEIAAGVYAWELY